MDGRLERADVCAFVVKDVIAHPFVAAEDGSGVPRRLLEAAALGRLDLAQEANGGLGGDSRERDRGVPKTGLVEERA